MACHSSSVNFDSFKQFYESVSERMQYNLKSENLSDKSYDDDDDVPKHMLSVLWFNIAH